jgi:mannose-6-phosphate isomerase-like protein (cupin superfamily)
MSCVCCGEPAKSQCATCQKAIYCTSECQSLDWVSGHKDICCNTFGIIVKVKTALKCPHLAQLMQMYPALIGQLPASNFTFFAPTNAAFEKWGGSLKGDALTKFIQHHVVLGPVAVEDLKAAKQIKPRQGLPIEVSQTDKGSALGTDFKAHIVESVECEGKVFIHKIDHPLLSEYVDGIGDIEQMTLENTFYRRTVVTSERAQIVLMSLVPGAWVEREIHEKMTQFIRFEQGVAKVELNDKEHEASDGDFVLVAAKTKHAIFNFSSNRLQLYTIYSFDKRSELPHPKDLIEKTQVMYEVARKSQ